MPVPTISNAISIPLGREGRPFLQQLAATEDPTSWRISAGALPPGLQLTGALIAVTVVAATDLFTAAEHGLLDRDQVRFPTGETVPAPLLTDTDYFVVNATRDTFQLALEPGGAAIDITGPETGPMDLQRWPLGRVVGVPQLAGVYQAQIIATNASGDSAEQPFHIGIEVGEIDSGSAFELDIDLDTRFVRNPGAGNEWALPLKRYDNPLVSVGFVRRGLLQSLPISLLLLGVKMFEEEGLAMLNDGTVERIGPWFAPRYLIRLNLGDPEVVARLNAWFSDGRVSSVATDFLGLFEFEWTEVREVFQGAGAEDLVQSSRTFRSPITRDLIPAA